jgi:hypothetical protein
MLVLSLYLLLLNGRVGDEHSVSSPFALAAGRLWAVGFTLFLNDHRHHDVDSPRTNTTRFHRFPWSIALFVVLSFDHRYGAVS